MKRRNLLGSTLALGTLAKNVSAADEAASANFLQGEPLVAGPDADSMALLQAVTGPASGHAEITVNQGPPQIILPERNGLIAFEPHVLKFLLPPLPPGATVTYRIKAWTVAFKNAYSISTGPKIETAAASFRTLDPAAASTSFVVWNDTHEQAEVLKALHNLTVAQKPDFLLWNGDQTNDVSQPSKMANQFICPNGLPIARTYPLAYLRGNHDLRGAAARFVADFTHCPGSDFTHAFRSGPVACLCMDTGEDKPDDHPVFVGMVNCDAMRTRQTRWLEKTIELPWFRTAPYKLLFCHIPLWWKEGVQQKGYSWYHPACRDAWLPLLTKAGVQMVVSGHTHEPISLPKSNTRPIHQLIGGGPSLKSATLTSFSADAKRCHITMQALDGTMLHDISIPPV